MSNKAIPPVSSGPTLPPPVSFAGIHLSRDTWTLGNEAASFLRAILRKRGFFANCSLRDIRVDCSEYRGTYQLPLCLMISNEDVVLYIDAPFAPLFCQNKAFLIALACWVESTVLTAGANYVRNVKAFTRTSSIYRGSSLSAIIAESFTKLKDFNVTEDELKNVGFGQFIASVGSQKAMSSSVQMVTKEFVQPPYWSLLKIMVEAGRHIQLLGPKGIGKSLGVEVLARIAGKDLFNINCDSRTSRADIIGTKEIKDGTSFFKASGFVNAVRTGQWAILNEINMAEPDAVSMLNGIIASPFELNLDGEIIPVHDEFRLFVTYNPDYVGTKPISEALEDRMFPIPVTYPNSAMLKGILVANEVPVDMVPYLDKFAQKVWEAAKNHTIKYDLSIRRLLDMSEMLRNKFSWQDAVTFSVLSMVKNPNDRLEIDRLASVSSMS